MSRVGLDNAQTSALPRRITDSVREQLGHVFPVGREWSWHSELLIGILAAVLAVAVRFALPLSPQQLPVLSVVVMLAVVTTFVGVRAGITTAVLGGLASFYLFFNAYSWSLANGAWVPLFGFAVIAAVIITTSHLYRVSEQRHHEQEMAQLNAMVESAQLFAREMSHRQKNTLAIVQSMAFQTLGHDSPEAAKFTARLRTLAGANTLLDDHPEHPTASVRSVIEEALAPFRDGSGRFDIQSVDATIATGEVISLALALHELATNALKHGALSRERGRVSLKVDDVGDRLLMIWKEHGGPEVQHPHTRGFGSRLLQRSGIETKLTFEADGLLCSMGLRKSLR